MLMLYSQTAMCQTCGVYIMISGWFNCVLTQTNYISSRKEKANHSHVLLGFYYSGVIMSAMAFQNTGVLVVCSTVSSCADQRKNQSSAHCSTGFVRGIHWWPVDSPHRGPITWKMFPFDDAIRSKLYVLGTTCPADPIPALKSTELSRINQNLEVVNSSKWRASIQSTWRNAAYFRPSLAVAMYQSVDWYSFCVVDIT